MKKQEDYSISINIQEYTTTWRHDQHISEYFVGWHTVGTHNLFVELMNKWGSFSTHLILKLVIKTYVMLFTGPLELFRAFWDRIIKKLFGMLYRLTLNGISLKIIVVEEVIK